MGFQALIVGYVFVFLGGFASAPFIYGRLLVFFVMGGAMAFFVQGRQYGTIQPISTRPIMIGLGVIVMAASLIWGFAIRNHL